MKGAQLSARSQIAYYGLGIVLMKGVSLLMLPIVTRYLTPSEYGVLDVLLTWMNLLSIVLGMGFAEVLYRFSRNTVTQASVYNSLLQLHIWILLPLLLLGSALCMLAAPWLPASLQWSLLLLSLWAAGLASALTLPLCWLRMQDHADWFFYCTAGKALLQALCCWALLQLGYGVLAVLYASLFSHIVLICLVLYKTPVTWHFPGFSQSERGYLRYGVPLIFSGLCLFLVFGAERWIIAGVLSASVLAQYAVASQFALMVAVCVEPFTLWWYPKRLAMLAEPDGLQRVANTAVLGCILTIAAALLIGAAGPWVIRWLIPQAYHQAAGVLPWLCLVMAFKQCSHLLNTGCYVGESTLQIGKINGALAVLAPCLYLAGCLLAALDGLIAALVLVYGLRLAWFYRTSQQLLHLPYPHQALLSVLAAASCVFVLGHFVSAISQLTLWLLVILLCGWQALLLWRWPGAPTIKGAC